MSKKKKKLKLNNIPPLEENTPLLELFVFKENSFEESKISDLSSLPGIIESSKFVWLNVDCFNTATITEVSKIFNFHKLTIEDVLNTHQRPKIEEYDDYFFIICRMLTLNDYLDSEQLSIFCGKNFVLTLQNKPGDCLDSARKRIRSLTKASKSICSGHLLYLILDSVIDSYFPIMEDYSERLDELENIILDNHSQENIKTLHNFKRDFVTLRRNIWPLREVINFLLRDNSAIITDETKIYLRDCYDHVVRIMDLNETFRELSADLMDLYLSLVSNKMNEVIKVLTIISTIFIPLTFIVGVYGMNFNTDASPYNMPELNLYYGYPAVIGAMLTIVICLLGFFKRKNWL